MLINTNKRRRKYR